MDITQNHVTRDATYWSDEDCKTKIMTRHQTGSLVIGDPVDWTYRSVKVTNLRTADIPATADAAKTLNTSNACGHKDWAADKTLDVTGTACNGLSSESGQEVDEIQVSGPAPSRCRS